MKKSFTTRNIFENYILSWNFVFKFVSKNILRWYLNKEKTSLELHAHEINKKRIYLPLYVGHCLDSYQFCHFLNSFSFRNTDLQFSLPIFSIDIGFVQNRLNKKNHSNSYSTQFIRYTTNFCINKIAPDLKMKGLIHSKSKKWFKADVVLTQKMRPASTIVQKGNISFKPFMFSIPWLPNIVSSAIMKSFYHDH